MVWTRTRQKSRKLLHLPEVTHPCQLMGRLITLQPVRMLFTKLAGTLQLGAKSRVTFRDGPWMVLVFDLERFAI